jgi:predicted ABC-type ATPase
LAAAGQAQVARDHSTKLRLEAELRPKIRAARADLLRVIVRSLKEGALPDVATLSAEALEPILLEHYRKVETEFLGRLGDQLKGRASVTRLEKEEIEEILDAHFPGRAAKQAGRIAGTDARNARTSSSIAAAEKRRLEEEEDRSVSREEEALIAGAVLGRQFLRRERGITSFETQAPAEATKFAELQVLLDLTNIGDPALSAPPPGSTLALRKKPPQKWEGHGSQAEVEKKPTFKEWRSMGDSLVRRPPKSVFYNHLRADSGQVPTNKPFIVSGEALMFPGDTSLGATPGNVINCRCSSMVDVEEVSAARMWKTTEEKWKDANGEWLPERAKLHDEIVEHFSQGVLPVPEGEEKVFQMIAGGTASGKGTITKRGKLVHPPNAMKVDADLIKAELPEFQEARAAFDPAGAAFAHSESSIISDRLLARGAEMNANVILDGVGDKGLAAIEKRIARFRAKGYAIKADYVSVPTDVALKRAHLRATEPGPDKGRFVPKSITRMLHEGVSRDFPEAAAADIFDEVRLFDTNIPKGDDPRLVFSKVKGDPSTIHNEELWQEFLAKASP